MRKILHLFCDILASPNIIPGKSIIENVLGHCLSQPAFFNEDQVTEFLSIALGHIQQHQNGNVFMIAISKTFESKREGIDEIYAEFVRERVVEAFFDDMRWYKETISASLEGTGFYPWNFIVSGASHHHQVEARLHFLSKAAGDFGIDGVKLGFLDSEENVLALWDMLVSGAVCREESKLSLDVFCRLEDEKVLKVMYDGRSAGLDFVGLDEAGYAFVVKCFNGGDLDIFWKIALTCVNHGVGEEAIKFLFGKGGEDDGFIDAAVGYLIKACECDVKE